MGAKGIADVTRGRIDGQNAWRYEGPNPSPHQQEQTEDHPRCRATVARTLAGQASGTEATEFA